MLLVLLEVLLVLVVLLGGACGACGAGACSATSSGAAGADVQGPVAGLGRDSLIGAKLPMRAPTDRFGCEGLRVHRPRNDHRFGIGQIA